MWALQDALCTQVEGSDTMTAFWAVLPLQLCVELLLVGTHLRSKSAVLKSGVILGKEVQVVITCYRKVWLQHKLGRVNFSLGCTSSKSSKER